MRRWCFGAVILLLVSSPTEAQIPSAYHGRWSLATEQCAGNGEEPTVIGQAEIRFHESICRVTSARPANNGLAVRLRCSGEGETWTRTEQLRLVESGRLRIGAEARDHRRCEAQRSGPSAVGERWLVVASRNDRDEAIGIARLFRTAASRVFRSRNGVFAVALGPFEGEAGRVRREELLASRSIMQDAFFTRGETFVEEAWRPPSSAVAAEGDFVGGPHPLRLAVGDLEVTLRRERARRGEHNVVVAVGTVRGGQVFREIVGDEDEPSSATDEPRARVALVRLDRRTPQLQVVLSYYTRGAHCCTVTSIMTESAEGRWVRVEAGARDGDENQFEDIDGDGAAEIVGVDDRFLYAFASYAESSAPPTIDVLDGASLREAVLEPRFVSYLRQVYGGMAFSARADPDLATNNGFLGGYVGVAARLGRFDEAFRVAVAQHDRQSTWAYERCRVPQTGGQECPAGERQRFTFPDYLVWFLRQNGYLPAR